MILFINKDYHEKDQEVLGICQGDFSKLLKRLAEFRDDMYEACTPVYSFQIMFNLLSVTEISYRTDDAHYNGRVFYIDSVKKFYELFKYEYGDKSVTKVWLSVIREISDDIDILENRYGEEEASDFLRSLLVYFTQFDIVTKLRE